MAKEISISRKTVTAIVWVLTIAILVAGIGLVLRLRPELVLGVVNRIRGVRQNSATGSADAQAAVAGVTAFYSLDYTIPAERWEEMVCVTLTASGCEVFKALYAPGVRTIVEQNRWQTGCTAKAIERVEDTADQRVWRLEATLDHPLPGSPAIFPVYAEVVREADGTWWMTHVLNDGEASRFTSKAP